MRFKAGLGLAVGSRTEDVLPPPTVTGRDRELTEFLL